MSVAGAALTAIVQVLVFSAVPFLVYLVKHRTTRGFLRYVGLYAPERRTLLWATLLVLVTAPLFLWAFSTPGLREVATGPATVAGTLRRLQPGAESAAILLMYAWVQTSLAEEIFFRGFVAQRLIDRFGFAVGNVVQALLLRLVAPHAVPRHRRGSRGSWAASHPHAPPCAVGDGLGTGIHQDQAGKRLDRAGLVGPRPVELHRFSVIAFVWV